MQGDFEPGYNSQQCWWSGLQDPVDHFMLQASSMMRPVAGRNPHWGRRSSQSSLAQMLTAPSRRTLATVSL